MKLTMTKDVVRHSDIIDAMDAISLKEVWLKYIDGQTTQVIDENQPFDDLHLENDGVYSDDLERFCRWKNISVVINDETDNS